ncbi:hypothetical protein Hanom_Chr13g01230961 [Helianthus anomalus]
MFGDRAKGLDVSEDKSDEDLEQEYLDKFYENLDADNYYQNQKGKLQEYVKTSMRKNSR